MKVIVAGSRTFTDHKKVAEVLGQSTHHITRILHGGARGADTLGFQWAVKHGVPSQCFKADWDAHEHFAGVIRNKEMAEAGDMAVIFWDGKSKGTAHLLWCMDTLHKPVIVIDI